MQNAQVGSKADRPHAQYYLQKPQDHRKISWTGYSRTVLTGERTATDKRADGHYKVYYLPALISYAVDKNQDSTTLQNPVDLEWI